jgi:ribosome-binding protein aMBF1 (putative translation factor)
MTTTSQDLIPNQQVLEHDLEDPIFRDLWERTVLARAVALKILAYRTDRGLSQRALAAQVGMKQPQVARLESGEHNPTIDTLIRLSALLDVEIVFSVTPPSRKSCFPTARFSARKGTVVEEGAMTNGSKVLAAAS